MIKADKTKLRAILEKKLEKMDEELLLIQTLIEIVEDKLYPDLDCSVSSEELLDRAIAIAKERTSE